MNWTREEYEALKRKGRPDMVNMPGRKARVGGCVRCQVAPPKKHRAQHRKLTKAEGTVLAMLKNRLPGTHIIVQGVRLDFPDGEDCYFPDFVVCDVDGTIVVEVKGTHVGRVAWSREGIQKFKRAREYFVKWFRFQLWQKTETGWEIK